MVPLKIGAFGSRRCYTYDSESIERKELRDKITDILYTYISSSNNNNSNTYIYCYSGINLGLEQDFLTCCIHLHLPYTIILPYKASVLNTPNDEVNSHIDFLIEHACNIEYLSENIFSVKKNLLKKNKIIEYVDVLITNDTNLVNKEQVIYV